MDAARLAEIERLYKEGCYPELISEIKRLQDYLFCELCDAKFAEPGGVVPICNVCQMALHGKVKAERERCAKIAEECSANSISWNGDTVEGICLQIAKKIREVK